MPTTTVTPAFLGTFTATDGPFLNPEYLGMSGWSKSNDVFNDFGNTNNFAAGYIGEVAWYPQSDTPLITSGNEYYPSSYYFDQMAALTTNYNDYNS